MSQDIGKVAAMSSVAHVQYRDFFSVWMNDNDNFKMSPAIHVCIIVRKYPSIETSHSSFIELKTLEK